VVRLTEIALFLAPFALAAAWWVLGWRSRWVVWAAVGSLAVLALSLAWFGTAQRLPHGSRYVPARVENGRIVNGHGA
jgi:hypothetical protein